jgi:hypothetical protein
MVVNDYDDDFDHRRMPLLLLCWPRSLSLSFNGKKLREIQGQWERKKDGGSRRSWLSAEEIIIAVLELLGERRSLLSSSKMRKIRGVPNCFSFAAGCPLTALKHTAAANIIDRPPEVHYIVGYNYNN